MPETDFDRANTSAAMVAVRSTADEQVTVLENGNEIAAAAAAAENAVFENINPDQRLKQQQ